MTSDISELPMVVPQHDGGLPCQHENPRLWFSHLPAELNLAKLYCGGCPRRQPCLAGAVERAEPTGVWGGQIFDRGRIIDHKTARSTAQENLWGRSQMIHPVLLEQLAAEHVKDMIGTADKARRRQQARQARRRRTSPEGLVLQAAPRIDPQANLTTRPDHNRSSRDEDQPTPRRDQPEDPVLVVHGPAPSDSGHG